MLVLLVAATLAEAAGAAGAPRPTRTPAVWEQSLHLPGVFDLAGPRGDGRLVAAAHDRLVLVGPSGQTRSFAPAYSVPDGPESYMALSAGLTVAPRSFGSYGGQLIAADELGGSIYAISPGGRLSTVTRSDLPAGQDVGVESAGFVPARAAAAYLADRGTPGNPHQGTDSVLRLTGTVLTAAGVSAGDLLVATEGGANVVRVRCAGQCTSAVVATGPASAHGQGRLLITARPTSSSGGRAGAIAIGI